MVLTAEYSLVFGYFSTEVCLANGMFGCSPAVFEVEKYCLDCQASWILVMVMVIIQRSDIGP